MRSILPRRDETAINALLAGAMPLGRFHEDTCADTGGLSPTYSRNDSGVLYEIKFWDPESPGFLRFPRAARKARGIERKPYSTFSFECGNEAALRSFSLRELFERVPEAEREKCAGFEVIPKRYNCYGKLTAEVRLYEMANRQIY